MKIGLVLEGGANRGVFTSGVLDYFMEQDLGKAFRYVSFQKYIFYLSLSTLY